MENKQELWSKELYIISTESIQGENIYGIFTPETRDYILEHESDITEFLINVNGSKTHLVVSEFLTVLRELENESPKTLTDALFIGVKLYNISRRTPIHLSFLGTFHRKAEFREVLQKNKDTIKTIMDKLRKYENNLIERRKNDS